MRHAAKAMPFGQVRRRAPDRPTTGDAAPSLRLRLFSPDQMSFSQVSLRDCVRALWRWAVASHEALLGVVAVHERNAVLKQFLLRECFASDGVHFLRELLPGAISLFSGLNHQARVIGKITGVIDDESCLPNKCRR